MGHHTGHLSPRQAGVRVVVRGVQIAAITLVIAGCSGPSDTGASAMPVGPNISSPSVPSPSAAAPSLPTTTPVEAAHLTRSTPVRLQIPAIGVDPR